jgi:hypothetical protein
VRVISGAINLVLILYVFQRKRSISGSLKRRTETKEQPKLRRREVRLFEIDSNEAP